MPLTASSPRCIASDFMKDGAKVFDAEPPFLEPERCPNIVLLLRATPPASEEYDRVCEGLWVKDSGEEIVMDFGLPLGAVGPGDGDEALKNWLLRICPGFEAILE